MNYILFFIGVSLTVTGVVFSYHPFFENYEISYLSIPYHKSDDFPKDSDMILTNVYMTCQMSDNLFINFTVNDTPICETASQLFPLLLILVLIGIVIMLIGASKCSKKIERNLK